MMMAMLEAGGIPILTDNLRQPDEDNPKGYYEYEPVKALRKSEDKSWLEAARGKAVKVISELLMHLPPTHFYKVVFMNRDIREVISSQDTMLAHRGAPSETGLESDLLVLFEEHLKKVIGWIDEQPSVRAIEVDYKEAVAEPILQAERIRRFLESPLDIKKMASVVDEKLYRNRS